VTPRCHPLSPLWKVPPGPQAGPQSPPPTRAPPGTGPARPAGRRPRGRPGPRGHRPRRPPPPPRPAGPGRRTRPRSPPPPTGPARSPRRSSALLVQDGLQGGPLLGRHFPLADQPDEQLPPRAAEDAPDQVAEQPARDVLVGVHRPVAEGPPGGDLLEEAL